MNLRFELNDKEQSTADAWMKKMRKEHPANGGVTGGRFTFTMTSLGDEKKVFDSVTKEEIDITDYDLW